jgi:hypothetical protein
MTTMRKRELAYRENDGLAVSLLWDPADDALTVTVLDGQTGETLEIPVADASPLEVSTTPSPTPRGAGSCSRPR